MPISRRSLLGLAVAGVWDLLPRGATAGAANLTLEAKPAGLRLLPPPASETPVWAFGATVPGPLLRVPRHGEVKVRLLNSLEQPTTLHWHGMRIANSMDGIAGLTQAAVAPGKSFDYRFVAPDAGLYWYHPHVMPEAAEQIGRGLYGVLIVDESKLPPVDDDILVVLDDWRLDPEGEIVGDFLDPKDAGAAGRIGKLVTLNSKPIAAARTTAPGARLRLRLLNAANAEIMVLKVDGARPLIIAIDGQACEPFEPVRRSFPMGPGARFELLIDMPRDPDVQVRLVLRAPDAADRDLLIVTTRGAPLAARPDFAGLPLNSALPAEIALQNAKRVDFTIAPVEKGPAGVHWSLNGVAAAGLPTKPAFSVKRGTPLTIGFSNKSGIVQAMRVHGHVMRLLHDLDDGWEPYWRDSLIIEPGKTHHVAFVADNPGKWLIQSAILDHAMTGSATWFEVT